MTPWFLVLFLLVWSGPAFGDWVPLGGDDKKGLTIYADTTGTSYYGLPTTVWILYDFESVQGKEEDRFYRSVKVQREYDCRRERRRLLEILHYAGPMGLGEVVFTNTFSPARWIPTAPVESGTLANDLWTRVCRKSQE